MVSSPPILEKVKGHDTAAQRAGAIKALGNEQVDLYAKEAARGASQVATPDPRFADAVLLKDPSGTPISDVGAAVALFWWDKDRREGNARRPWLACLYPDGVKFDWKASTHMFRPPVVSSGAFIFVAAPATQKWVARARADALATQVRLAKSHRSLTFSPHCLCCTEPVEDDVHLVTGCTGSGSAEVKTFIPGLWSRIVAKRGFRVPFLLDPLWVSAHTVQLAVGLIPRSITTFLAGWMPGWYPRF